MVGGKEGEAEEVILLGKGRVKGVRQRRRTRKEIGE